MINIRTRAGVHVSLGVHLPISRGTFEVSNRREKCFHISIISKCLHIYQWILFSEIIICQGWAYLCNRKVIYRKPKTSTSYKISLLCQYKYSKQCKFYI